MSYGVSMALNEITLVLFTTLSPSSVIACVILALLILAAPLSAAERLKIDRGMGLPLGLSMIGLIASATHLGSPENALYVFTRVGDSPLSNEVFSAVLFLSACGLFWLLCFMEKQHVTLQRVLSVFIIITGCLCVVMIGLAYNAPSIIGWHNVYVPLNLIFSAFVGGPLLALFTLLLVFRVPPDKRFTSVLLVLSTFMLVINLIVLFVQNAGLADVWNSFTTLAEMIPMYIWMIGVYGVLGCAAIVLMFYQLLKVEKPSFVLASLSLALFFAGLFVVRFGFYMMHMTVGLGL